MTLELTTNGWICGYNHTGYKNLLLGRCLEASVSHGPIILYANAMGWQAHNIRLTVPIPRSAIEEEYSVVRDPDSMFPEVGIVYVLNRQPTLRSPPVAEHMSEDLP